MSVAIRTATPADRPGVLELMSASLGWGDDGDYGRFFAWKHDENPAGASPAWVACDADRIVGFRALMRWRWLIPGAGVVDAVRAVDTATHPDYQGQGIFRALTTRAVDELTEAGVGFVFNTPNDQSRPGYLKMGWEVVGRVPIRVRATGPAGAWRTARARTAAEKWSEPDAVAESAIDLLAGSGVDELVDAQPAPTGISTDARAAHLRWRYGFEPLNYRAVTGPGGVEGGVAIFRRRRRGEAIEATLCEVLAPNGDQTATRQLVEAVVAQAQADYVLATPRTAGPRMLFAPLPGQGPTLTWRALARRSRPELAQWTPTLGDLELF